MKMTDMDTNTLSALKECIEKYETAAVAPTDELIKNKFNASECSLCEATGGICNTCPVGISGHMGCADTPWDTSDSGHHFSEHTLCYVARYARIKDCAAERSKELVEAIADHLRERCRAEAEFLKTLLPTDDTNDTEGS